MDELKPKDHAESVALFRSEVIGHLKHCDLDRGELSAELRRLSRQRFRPPGVKRTRTFSVPTLERWYYAYRTGGLEALRPRRRSDRGRALGLDSALRQLLLDVRREHRSASVPLVMRTLIAEGRLGRNMISAATIRRLYVEHGLDRIPLRDQDSPRARLRWQANRPGALWHADVCHGRAIRIDDRSKPVRIHAILDDASRYVVAIRALHNERELDMLHLFVSALRKHGAPDVIYLDNGSTYRGQVLRTGCERLGVTLLHAAPYDPQARGKMERFWRTLRSQCLDFVGQMTSLHDLNVRLWAWLDMHYHSSPHAGLIGRSPGRVYAEGMRGQEPDDLDEGRIAAALTVHERRRVRRDSTLSVAGRDFQLDQGFLTGRVVTVAYCMLDEPPEPVVIHDDKRYPLHLVDPVHNAHTRRQPRRRGEPQGRPKPSTGFNPAETVLKQATGRLPKER